jgi:hypothetical protein
MNTSIVSKRRSELVGVAALFAAGSLIALLSAHCYPSVSEGERCNPYLSHNECAGDPGISCVVPSPSCSVAYCCGPSSTSDNCLGKAPDCVMPEAGADGDDGGGEAGSEASAPDAASETGADAGARDADAGPG